MWHVKSFNGKLRDELLNGEIFYTLLEAEVLIERWQEHYSRVRPHTALGYRPPTPEATLVSADLGGRAPSPPGFSASGKCKGWHYRRTWRINIAGGAIVGGRSGLPAATRRENRHIGELSCKIADVEDDRLCRGLAIPDEAKDEAEVFVH